MGRPARAARLARGRAPRPHALSQSPRRSARPVRDPMVERRGRACSRSAATREGGNHDPPRLGAGSMNAAGARALSAERLPLARRGPFLEEQHAAWLPRGRSAPHAVRAVARIGALGSMPYVTAHPGTRPSPDAACAQGSGDERRDGRGSGADAEMSRPIQVLGADSCGARAPTP